MPESQTRLQVSNISDMCKYKYDDLKFGCDFQELHVVYDSYLELSLKFRSFQPLTNVTKNSILDIVGGIL